jgi:hypothetical protein
MCLLSICNTRHFTDDEFKTAFEKNDDGVGFGWIEKGKIKFRKGFMDKEVALAKYRNFCEKNIFPYILHFRLGSPTVPELTHPFIISENSELLLKSNNANGLLFHNGIISGWEGKLFSLLCSMDHIPKGEWSDTRMLAIAINKLGEGIIDFVNGKFVTIIDEKIMYYGDFDDADGIMMSNNSYKSYKNNWSRKEDDKKPENDWITYKIIM